MLNNILNTEKIIPTVQKYKNTKKIIHILTPSHENMGDQAIAYATNELLKNEFSEYKTIEIYRNDIYLYAKAIKRIMNKDDIIFTIGGGNMGNLWIKEERDRRFVIRFFKNNKIISMPQTISFTPDDDGKKELEKTKRIYNKHKNLVLIARENKSFNIMKKEFINANIILNPDTVLYLFDKYNANDNRKGIMLCLRNDKESVLTADKNLLINSLNNNYNDVFNHDTVIGRNVLKEDREKELEKMLYKFKNSRLVITDRLHGMVFAAITKTPCIVTKSLDHKVTGTYEWIKKLNYIKLVDNLEFENIKPLIDELTNLDELTNINFTQSYFKNLRSKIGI